MGVVGTVEVTPELELRAKEYSDFLIQNLIERGYVCKTTQGVKFKITLLSQIGLHSVTHDFRCKPHETHLLKMKFAIGENQALWFSEFQDENEIYFDLDGTLNAIIEEIKIAIFAETLKFELEIKHQSDMKLLAKALKVRMVDDKTISRGRVKIRFIPGRPHLAIVVFGGVKEALEIAEKYSGVDHALSSPNNRR